MRWARLVRNVLHRTSGALAGIRRRPRHMLTSSSTTGNIVESRSLGSIDGLLGKEAPDVRPGARPAPAEKAPPLPQAPPEPTAATTPLPGMSGSTSSRPDHPIVCSGCEGPLTIRTENNKGTFLGCSWFPKCAPPWTNTFWLRLPRCWKCGECMVMRVNKQSRQVFLGCSQWPKCDGTVNYPAPRQPGLPPCSKCRRRTVLRVDKHTGLPYVGCQSCDGTSPWPSPSTLLQGAYAPYITRPPHAPAGR